MQTKFTSPVKGHNKGSCLKLATYLEKENDKKIEAERSYFFSIDRDRCNKWEVVQQIDTNGKGQGLERKDDRFYSIVISPSQAELAHIGTDSQGLKDYTRQVMENYAANFGKGIDSRDLVWYAKIEHERKHGFDSPDVKAGLAQANELKLGDQRHIHIIVSRCAAREHGHVLQAERLLTHPDRTMSLSPMTNQRGIHGGAVKSGFDRDAFFRANERSFDEQFGYERGLAEGYDYCNAIKNGSLHHYEQSLSQSRGMEIMNEPTRQRSIDHSAGLTAGF
ncbi:DUF5712 family protein [Spirosoma gilvum]